MKNITLIKKVQDFICKHKLLPKGSKVVLGLSGGPDSMFLLHLLTSMRKQEKIEIIAAHLNHEWRPDSSKGVAFCSKASQKLGVPFYSAKISELSLSLRHNGSKEESGRKARRHFLQSVATKNNANVIALAHHAQDQQETFFIRLIRGATLTGLTAMKPKYGMYIRPLLKINKTDILDFLHANAISYLVDPSNNSDAFLRNRIRSAVLPALQASDSRFDKNFLTTLGRLQETEALLEQLAAQTLQNICSLENNSLQVKVSSLLELHPALRYRVILAWLCKEQVPFSPTQNFLDEILHFLQQPGSKSHAIHKSWTIVKKKNMANVVK